MYTRNFLELCRDYEVPGYAAIPRSVLNVDRVEAESDNSAKLHKTPQDVLNEASNKRASKISALKQKMDHQEKMRELQRKIDGGCADDDVEVTFTANTVSWLLYILMCVVLFSVHFTRI